MLKFSNERLTLFLDDIREPFQVNITGNILIARNVNEARDIFLKHWQEITCISLDHDLGTDPDTGYTFLIELAHNHMDKLRNKLIWSHSANPCGRANINALVKLIEREA